MEIYVSDYKNAEVEENKEGDKEESNGYSLKTPKENNKHPEIEKG